MGDIYSFDAKNFHNNVNKVYFGDIGDVVIKKNELMSTVIYNPVHLNENFDDLQKRGNGKVHSKWIFSEDGNSKENISSTRFNLMIDFFMEPNATMGLHFHHEKEEIYYILSGSIDITILDKNNNEFKSTLTQGDAHFLKLGQGHYGQAGPNGCRILTVCIEPCK